MGSPEGLGGEAAMREGGRRLTVVMPTYNRCELLGRALRGLLDVWAQLTEGK